MLDVFLFRFCISSIALLTLYFPYLSYFPIGLFTPKPAYSNPMLFYYYYWISTLVVIPYSLISFLLLLVTSCCLYTYVIGLSCLLQY